MIDNEIAIACDLIRNKCGIVIPDIFLISDEHSYMQKNSSVRGLFVPYGKDDTYCCTIYISPKLNKERTFEEYKNYFDNLVSPYNLTWKKEEYDKQLDIFIKKEKERQIDNKVRTIIHECGHFVHYWYFQNKAMNIPTKKSVRRGYAKKNALENFAVAFEEYIRDDIDKESARYKRIENILKNVSINDDEDI